MSVPRLEHIGIVVDDIDAAIAFFAEIGLELQGRMSVDGDAVDRVNGLEGVKAEVAMLDFPDGHTQLELARYHAPAGPVGEAAAPANTPGIRHILFAVEDAEEVLARLQAQGGELVGDLVNYEDTYKLCYVRGPAGIIVELAEKLG